MLSSFLRRPLGIDGSHTHCYSPMRETAVSRVSRTHRMSGWFCQNLFNTRRLPPVIGERSEPGSWSEEESTGMAKSQTFERVFISGQISGRVKTLWFWGGSLSFLRRQGTTLNDNQSCSQHLLPPWSQLEGKDKSPNQPVVLLDAQANVF